MTADRQKTGAFLSVVVLIQIPSIWICLVDSMVWSSMDSMDSTATESLFINSTACAKILNRHCIYSQAYKIWIVEEQNLKK